MLYKVVYFNIFLTFKNGFQITQKDVNCLKLITDG